MEPPSAPVPSGQSAPPGPGGGPGPRKRSKAGVILIVIAAFGGCCLIGGGVLAAIGIPAFVKYVKRAKSSEARAHLRELGNLTVGYCSKNRELPEPMGPVPATIPAGAAEPVDFDAEGRFAGLGFTGQREVHYQLRFERTGVIDGQWIAEGDLDGDGETSRFVLKCSSSPCECANVPEIDRELE